MATKEEILLQQRDRALEKAAQEQQKAKQIERLLAGEYRRKENRRKYIAGGYLLTALMEGQQPCHTYEDLLRVLDKTLTKDVDRRAFDLKELTSEEKAKRRPKRRRKSSIPKAKKASSKSQSKDIQIPKTSLPPSLVEATLTGHADTAQNGTEVPVIANDTAPVETPSPRRTPLPENPQDASRHFPTL